MTRPVVNQPGSCPCGQTTFSVKGKPVLRFFCHCQICQTLYQEPCADVTVFWTGAIAIPEQAQIQYKTYRPPPALKRATCPACQNPLFGFLTLAPFLRLEFVSTRNFADKSDFPLPSAHIFYHRRKAEIQDALPKISGYLPSELAVTKLVLANSLFALRDRP